MGERVLREEFHGGDVVESLGFVKIGPCYEMAIFTRYPGTINTFLIVCLRTISAVGAE